MAENKSTSFEHSLARLETIVKELEGQDVDLDRSVELFKEGRVLVKRCEDLLKSAEATLQAADGATAAAGTAERVDDNERPDDDSPF